MQVQACPPGEQIPVVLRSRVSGQESLFGRGRGGGLFSCPYPLKVQACPPREQIPVLRSRASGQECLFGRGWGDYFHAHIHSRFRHANHGKTNPCLRSSTFRKYLTAVTLNVIARRQTAFLAYLCNKGARCSSAVRAFAHGVDGSSDQNLH